MSPHGQNQLKHSSESFFCVTTEERKSCMFLYIRLLCIDHKSNGYLAYYSYSSLMKCFFHPQKFCVVYINFTGYQMKA